MTTSTPVWLDENIDPMDSQGATYCARCGLFPLTVSEGAAHTCQPVH